MSLGNSELKAGFVTYGDVKALGNDTSTLIIDVRNSTELEQTGKIPGSIHIPINEVHDVLKNLPPDQFRERYQREKPGFDTPLVFSCQRGVRSARAGTIALNLGYVNVKDYSGSWLDWEAKSKQENTLSNS
ncbi:Rhodanese-like domain [Popillia japonica]|uniref:Rhodanese-like domain n=1 Tax=Popillia japonica TaxID=7064 RepID=A0AAW1LUZ7_POPJA